MYLYSDVLTYAIFVHACAAIPVHEPVESFDLFLKSLPPWWMTRNPLHAACKPG